MLHLDDQSMPYYQERVTGEVNTLNTRVQELKRELHHPDQRSGALGQDELNQLEASLREIERKLNQLPGLPEEMRQRVREELEAALQEARSRLDQLSSPSKDEG